MKSHAKDYLLELSNNSATEYWLKRLIHVAITCNGDISDALSDEIYESFKLNTRAITEKSQEAHEELLTRALKERFEEELHHLGVDNLKVLLIKRNVKGVSVTALALEKNNEIITILSEGEQKAVALALFLAETRTAAIPIPIVFDDPVNSLDHHIASDFAKRLLALDNQIIIFTHSKLFLDNFETAKNCHICKNIISCSNTKSKHITIYRVYSEARDRKGVLAEYKSRDAASCINEAQKKLKREPLEDLIGIASSLRTAVECIVDEVIFNRQVPTKYSNKNSRIHWDELKRLCTDTAMIDKLRSIHDRLSGGCLHNGTESNENEITVEEFNTMISDLNEILINRRCIEYA